VRYTNRDLRCKASATEKHHNSLIGKDDTNAASILQMHTYKARLDWIQRPATGRNKMRTRISRVSNLSLSLSLSRSRQQHTNNDQVCCQKKKKKDQVHTSTTPTNLLFFFFCIIIPHHTVISQNLKGQSIFKNYFASNAHTVSWRSKMLWVIERQKCESYQMHQYTTQEATAANWSYFTSLEMVIDDLLQQTAERFNSPISTLKGSPRKEPPV